MGSFRNATVKKKGVVPCIAIFFSGSFWNGSNLSAIQEMNCGSPDKPLTGGQCKDTPDLKRGRFITFVVRGAQIDNN